MFQPSASHQAHFALSPLVTYAIQASKPPHNSNDKKAIEQLKASYPTDSSTKLLSLTSILKDCQALGFDAHKIASLSTHDQDTTTIPNYYPGVSPQFKHTLKEKCRSLLIELIFTCQQYPQQTDNIRIRFNTCDIGVGKNCPEGNVEELDRITQSLSRGTLQSILYSTKYTYIKDQASFFFDSKDNSKYFRHLEKEKGDTHQVDALLDSVKTTYNLKLLEESRSKDHKRFSLSGDQHKLMGTKNAFASFLDQQLHSQDFEDFLSESVFNSWQMPDQYKALAQPKLSLSKNPEEPLPGTLYIDTQKESIQFSITEQSVNKKGVVTTTFSTATLPQKEVTKLTIHGVGNLNSAVLQTDVFFSHLCTYLADETDIPFRSHHYIIDDWQKHYKGLFSDCQLSDQHWHLIFSLLSFSGGVGQDIFARARPSASKRLIANYLFEVVSKQPGSASNTMQTLLEVQTRGIPSDDDQRELLLNELLPHVEQHELFSWFTEQLATYECYNLVCNTLFTYHLHQYKKLNSYLLAEQAIIATHWQSLTPSSNKLARITSLEDYLKLPETVIDLKNRFVDAIDQKQNNHRWYDTLAQQLSHHTECLQNLTIYAVQKDSLEAFRALSKTQWKHSMTPEEYAAMHGSIGILKHLMQTKPNTFHQHLMQTKPNTFHHTLVIQASIKHEQTEAFDLVFNQFCSTYFDASETLIILQSALASKNTYFSEKVMQYIQAHTKQIKAADYKKLFETIIHHKHYATLEKLLDNITFGAPSPNNPLCNKMVNHLITYAVQCDDVPALHTLIQHTRSMYTKAQLKTIALHCACLHQPIRSNMCHALIQKGASISNAKPQIFFAAPFITIDPTPPSLLDHIHKNPSIDTFGFLCSLSPVPTYIGLSSWQSAYSHLSPEDFATLLRRHKQNGRTISLDDMNTLLKTVIETPKNTSTLLPLIIQTLPRDNRIQNAQLQVFTTSTLESIKTLALPHQQQQLEELLDCLHFFIAHGLDLNQTCKKTQPTTLQTQYTTPSPITTDPTQITYTVFAEIVQTLVSVLPENYSLSIISWEIAHLLDRCIFAYGADLHTPSATPSKSLHQWMYDNGFAPFANRYLNPQYKTYLNLKKLKTWYATGDFLCNPFSWSLLMKQPLSGMLLLAPKLILLPIMLLLSCYKPFVLFIKSFKAKERVTDNSLQKLCVSDPTPSTNTTPNAKKQTTAAPTYAVPSKLLHTPMFDAGQNALAIQQTFFYNLHTAKEMYSTSACSKRFHRSQKNTYATPPQLIVSPSPNDRIQLRLSLGKGYTHMQQLATFFSRRQALPNVAPASSAAMQPQS